MLVNIQNNSIHLSLPEGEVESRIYIFNMIRDIPYAVLPELNSYQTFTRILELKGGSCMTKHLLLCNLFQTGTVGSHDEYFMVSPSRPAFKD